MFYDREIDIDLKMKFCAVVFAWLVLVPTSALAENTDDSAAFRQKMSTAPDVDRITLFNISYSVRQSIFGKDLVKTTSPEYQRVSQMLENRNCSCSFTVQKNGSVTDVFMLKSSGSETVDEKAMSLLRKIVLFKVNEPVWCVVYFPSGMVTSYKDAISPIKGIP